MSIDWVLIENAAIEDAMHDLNTFARNNSRVGSPDVALSASLAWTLPGHARID